MTENGLASFGQIGAELLRLEDPELYRLLAAEHERQARTLALVASSSIVDPSVLACEATAAVNVTAEGYPGRRFHAGCRIIDGIEQLAIDRARAVFGARYANVQPHCASSANEIVMFAVLRPGDTILGMQLEHGGHLTHGASVSISGRYFNAVRYGLDRHGFIDYDAVASLARACRPRLIVCGATAYPRAIDFERFRDIADQAGAYLLADITHVAGLVAAGLHPNPIDHAHFTTTCTHKQLYGPRGGLILLGREASTPVRDGAGTLADLVQRAVFPLVQGAPAPHVIAAKARALARVAAPDFPSLAHTIVSNARALASRFVHNGYDVVSGGTDNHIVLVDVSTRGLTGAIAERALEQSGIIVNRNKIPGDSRPPRVTGGIRLGTNSVSLRRLGTPEMATCGDLVDAVLASARPAGDIEYELPVSVRQRVLDAVRQLCDAFPIPRYTAAGVSTAGS